MEVAIIGSGPAGLMAASRLADSGLKIGVFERRKGLGRKLLIAGSSGLNVSYDAPLEEFLKFYRVQNPGKTILENAIRDFLPAHWRAFIESLGHETFIGTSRRIFVREMKASALLKSWTKSLEAKGVQFFTGQEWTGLDDRRAPITVLALGGGSWEEQTPRWPELLRQRGIHVNAFESSNVGFEIDFSKELIQEADGMPVKNCSVTTSLGSKAGELVVTRYGLEGTPLYFVGAIGKATLNLKPELSVEAWLRNLSKPMKENLSPMRRMKKLGGLSEGALALVFHLASSSVKADLKSLATFAQSISLNLLRPRPLEEAISSKGGVAWSEVDESLMLKKLPGVYVAGEMLDWDAPTGGFLIQGSVALGARAGDSIKKCLS